MNHLDSDIAELPAVWTPPVQQRLYRHLLEAMAYPGRVHDLVGLLDGERALTGVIATCCDRAVTLADPQYRLDAQVRRFSAAPEAEPQAAAWVVVDGTRPPPSDWQPSVGTISEPERSATLVLEILDFDVSENPVVLRGPGIAETQILHLGGLDTEWIDRRAQWCARPPLGVDLICCTRSAMCAIPRTTAICKEP